jgi:DNA-binding transcriptional LysR family regulator
MGREQVRRLDLNLLLAFESLMAERSVTRAAERMSVGQPAMSASLARLRTFFGDPLLVRDGRSLVPTPRALELTASFEEALDLIDSALRASRGFDPRTARLHHVQGPRGGLRAAGRARVRRDADLLQMQH